ncbi:hypothetical protein [Streptomyces sp. B22F1]|uniref:hypothetical protein n=1 Tax=Streptomyces sp. B22F1 TaxID=3153566 RepID=UPI00325C82FF
MNRARSSPLKSLNGTARRTEHAGITAPAADAGARQGVARQGVPSALPPQPPRADNATGDGRYVVAWLHVSAPARAVPSARSVCLCGWDQRATGLNRVLALIDAHTAHRDTCPLRNSEGRSAA